MDGSHLGGRNEKFCSNKTLGTIYMIVNTRNTGKRDLSGRDGERRMGKRGRPVRRLLQQNR